MDLNQSAEALEKAVEQFEKDLAEAKSFAEVAYKNGFDDGVASVRIPPLVTLVRYIAGRVDEIFQQVRKTFLVVEDLANRNPIPVASVIEFYTLIDGIKRKVSSMFLAADKKLPLSLEIKDKAGNPAKVDGKPVFSLSDDSAGSLEVAEDGMSAVFTPAGKAVALKIQAKADADLGEGVKEIVGELDVEVLSGEAVFVGIVAGEPLPIAPAEPVPPV